MSPKPKKVFYAGDSGPAGPASYLLAVLIKLGIVTTHVPPYEKIEPYLLEEHYDAFIFSDYPHAQVDPGIESRIAGHILEGAGLLMVGGWASFTGSTGGWRGSKIGSLLPVECLETDDRRNIPEGLFIQPKDKHPMFDGFSFSHSPFLCGVNEVLLKPGAHTILCAKPIHHEGDPESQNVKLSVGTKSYPLLVTDPDPGKRIAAFMTDIAPHWCGGLVDWGVERVKLSIDPSISVEVGSRYVEFLSRILRWLAG